MRKKSIVPSLISLVIIGGFLFVIFSLFVSEKNSDTVEEKKVEVLVASDQMPVGTIINLSSLHWREIPKNQVNNDYITREKTDLLRQIDGGVVETPVSKDEIIPVSRIIKTQGKSPLAAVIRDGMRAVTLPVNKIANVPSIIAPGDIVDIIVPKKTNNQSEGYFGETILRNIRVLAIDNALKKEGGSGEKSPTFKDITLELKADEAEHLAASIRDGQVIISMHSLLESTQNSQKSVLSNNSETKDLRVVKIMRGSEEKEVTINQAGK